MGRKKNAVGSDPLDALDAEGLASLLPETRAPAKSKERKRSKPTSKTSKKTPKGTGKAAREEPPETTDAHAVERGRKVLAEGDLATARAAFEDALGTDRHRAALVGLADVHLARGEPEAAVKRLEEAVEAAPDDAGIAVRLGRARIEVAAYGDAEDVLKRAIRIAPESAEARCEMGILMTKKGLYDAAIEELDRALRLDPELARAHFYAGVCHNQRDRLEEARRAFEHAVDLDPSHDRAWYHLGIVHDRRGAVDRAREMYRRAREAAEVSS